MIHGPALRKIDFYFFCVRQDTLFSISRNVRLSPGLCVMGNVYPPGAFQGKDGNRRWGKGLHLAVDGLKIDLLFF